MKKQIQERNLSSQEIATQEKILKDLKQNKSQFVKRYGPDAEKIMFGIATKRAKQQSENMNKEKIKETIKTVLSGSVQESKVNLDDVIANLKGDFFSDTFKSNLAGKVLNNEYTPEKALKIIKALKDKKLKEGFQGDGDEQNDGQSGFRGKGINKELLFDQIKHAFDEEISTSVGYYLDNSPSSHLEGEEDFYKRLKNIINNL